MREITPPSTYLPVEGKELQNLENTAEHVRSILAKQLGDEARYDANVIRLLSDDLDRNRQRYTADEESKTQIMWTYGAFLGKALIENLPPGRCSWVDNKVDNFCLKVITAKGEETFAAPFTRIVKQLVDGPEHSMFAFYATILEVAGKGMPAALPSMARIAERFLSAFRSGEEFPDGLSYRRALTQSNLDGSMESLSRIDALLDQVRTRHAPKREEFLQEAANQNFLYLVAFYMGETMARAAGARLLWESYEESIAADPELARTTTKTFQGSVICTFDMPDGTQKFLVPLVAIMMRTFDGTEKSVFRIASDFVAAAGR